MMYQYIVYESNAYDYDCFRFCYVAAGFFFFVSLSYSDCEDAIYSCYC